MNLRSKVTSSGGGWSGSIGRGRRRATLVPDRCGSRRGHRSPAAAATARPALRTWPRHAEDDRTTPSGATSRSSPARSASPPARPARPSGRSRTRPGPARPARPAARPRPAGRGRAGADRRSGGRWSSSRRRGSGRGRRRCRRRPRRSGRAPPDRRARARTAASTLCGGRVANGPASNAAMSSFSSASSLDAGVGATGQVVGVEQLLLAEPRLDPGVEAGAEPCRRRGLAAASDGPGRRRTRRGRRAAAPARSRRCSSAAPPRSRCACRGPPPRATGRSRRPTAGPARAAARRRASGPRRCGPARPRRAGGRPPGCGGRSARAGRRTARRRGSGRSSRRRSAHRSGDPPHAVHRVAGVDDVRRRAEPELQVRGPAPARHRELVAGRVQAT